MDLTIEDNPIFVAFCYTADSFIRGLKFSVWYESQIIVFQ